MAITAGIAAGVNVALNLALIRPMGALGAALSTVLTELLVTTLDFAFLPRALTSRLRPTVPLKAALASAIMAIPLVLFHGVNLLLLIGIGIATYFVAVFALRALPSDDWSLVKSALLKLGTT